MELFDGPITDASKNSKHLRITGTKEHLSKIIDDFVKKFKPVAYIFGYEEKGDNKHVHGFIIYDKQPATSTLSDFFKKHVGSGTRGAPNYYHKGCETNDLNNALYVMKELDLLKHNLSDRRFNELKQTTIKINEEKEQNQRHKLLNAFTNFMKDNEIKYKNYTDTLFKLTPLNKEDFQLMSTIEAKQKELISEIQCLSYIAKFIHKAYIEEYDKEPPLNHIKGYCLYIAHNYKSTQFTYQYAIERYYERMFSE